MIEPWLRFAVDAPIPLSDVYRTGEAVFLTSNEDRVRRYPALANVKANPGTRSSACIPLLIGGKPVGVLGLSFDRPSEFPPDDREFIFSLARQCAQALERARLYEAERRARAEAERASEAKSEFLATLSHELRTPLTPVLLSVSLMESHPDLPAELREDVAAIRRNVELESRLISDLLDLTRVARGKLQLDPQPVDVHLLVRAAIDICQRNAAAKLVVRLEAGEHIVNGDPTRLQQIFWNLISNAQKFTPAEGVITVRTYNVAGPAGGRAALVIEVSDTGAGIDPAVLPRLFSAFEQGDVRNTRQHAGLGLGLAISRQLAEAHGGTITASSAGVDRGSTFTVTLPTVVMPHVGPVALAPVVSATPTVVGSRSLGILLVEDHEPTLRILTRLLTRLGHRVTAVGTVAGATAAAAREEFDALVCDIGLPDGSGLDVIRRLRGNFANRAIALTGYGMDSDVEASRQAGFAQHLTKPVDLNRLQAALTELPNADERGA